MRPPNPSKKPLPPLPPLPPLRIIAALSLTAVGALCVACPGSLDDPARFGHTSVTGVPLDGAGCLDVPSAIFATTCTDSGCHNATDKAQGLDLASPDVIARIVGVSATGGAGVLVDPTTPEQSVLYQKLSSSPPYGTRMPFGKAPLDAVSLACVLSWITAMAPGAEGGTESDAAVAADASGPDDATSVVEPPESGSREGGSGPGDASRPDAARPQEAGATPGDAAAPVDGGAPDAIADVFQGGG